MADFTIKANDRLPSISATLVDADLAPVDLSDAVSVLFIMANATSRIVKMASAATIVNAVNGQVSYEWAASDTATVGEYIAEWQVTFPEGRTQTFPSAGYNTVSIVADLNNA